MCLPFVYFNVNRYRLYGQWKRDCRTLHPRLIRAYTDIIEKAKYIMK